MTIFKTNLKFELIAFSVLAIILEDIEGRFDPVFGRVTNELVSFAGLDIWNQNELLAESLNTYFNPWPNP